MKFRKFLRDLKERNRGRVARVVSLAKDHVVEAGGVLEKIDDADGICGLPGILEGNFRSDVLQTGLKVDAAFFLEFQKSEGNKRFADGGDAKFGIAGNFAVLREVGFTDAAAPEKRAVGYKGDAGARDVFRVEDFFCGVLKFFEGFGVREFVFFWRRLLGRKQRGEEQGN